MCLFPKRCGVVFKELFYGSILATESAKALHRKPVERGAFEMKLIIILLVTQLMDDGQTAELIQGNRRKWSVV